MYAAANEIPDEVRLLCDPEERAYEAYGLLEGTPVEVLFDAPDEYLRCDIDAGRSLFEARESAGRPMVDNPWLLPGEFVVAQDGVPRDDVPVPVLRALDRPAGQRGGDPLRDGRGPGGVRRLTRAADGRDAHARGGRQ